MKNTLYKIAEQYKKEYNLNTRVDIVKEGVRAYFNMKGNYIFFGIDYIEKTYLQSGEKKRSGCKDFKSHSIFALLHEIYHAIDYKNNSSQFKQEIDNINFGLYKDDIKYHHAQPFEQRADEFARKELVKWKK